MSRDDEPIDVLLQRLRDGAGREESFRLLFDRFRRPLFRFFEHRGFSAEECQDLIQETFLRVYQGIDGFRGESRWEHWLFRIAANTAGKALRHRGAAKRAGQPVAWEDEDVADSPPQDPAPLRRLLGKEMKVTATMPDGTVKDMVWIKDWDYRWQDSYRYKEPLLLPRGTRVELVAYYDNTSANPRNPSSPPRRVRFGEQTTDEMAIIFYHVLVDPLVEDLFRNRRRNNNGARPAAAAAERAGDGVHVTEHRRAPPRP